MKLLLRELADGPTTTDEFVSVLRIAKRNVNQHLRDACALGWIHVTARERYNRPVWKLGPGRNARRIPLTPLERVQRSRQRRKTKA